jgi:hypothetical protein
LDKDFNEKNKDCDTLNDGIKHRARRASTKFGSKKVKFFEAQSNIFSLALYAYSKVGMLLL